MTLVLEPGERLGRYAVEQVLGRGGMGTVYKILDSRSNMPFAAKVLHSQLRGEGDFVRRFKREAKVAGRLKHMNVVHVFKLKRWHRTLFYVMELVDGSSLEEILKSQEVLPLDRSLALIREVAAALHYVHSKRCVHRDVKPGNVLVRVDGHVKLADFGLAQKIGRVKRTRSGHIMGTAKYMAPELIRGTRVGPQTDIYALGALAYELLAGKPPFEADNTEVYMDLHLYATPKSLQELREGLNRELSHFVGRMLEKSVSRRVPSARMVHSWLDFYLTHGFFADLPRKLRDY